MKKIGLMLMTALAFGFVACDDETKALPQSNAQEATMSASGLTVAYGSDIAGESIDLESLIAAGDKVNVITTEAVENLPAGATVEYKMQISANEDFSDATFMEVTDGVVSATEWDAWFRNNLGYAPDAKVNYVRFAAYVVEETSEVRLGGPEAFYAQKAITVTPVAIPLENSYYLVGTATNWSVADAIAFNHSGASVYEDPIFTLSVVIPEGVEGGWWWKVIPASTYETGDWVSADYASYGPTNGSEELSGQLYARTADADCGAGCLNISGPIQITLNMLEGTYDIKQGSPYLYTPGNTNSWSQGDSQMLFTSDFETYKGYAHLNGDFKFTSALDWNGTNYGNAGEEGKLSTDGGAGNLVAPADALYWCTVNIAELTYSLYQVTTIGVIGDATPGAWNTSTALTPSENFLVWTGDITFSGSGEWKIRANDDWAVNLGGDMNNLSQDGSNLPTPGEGTYTVTLNLSTLPYTVTVEAK